MLGLDLEEEEWKSGGMEERDGKRGKESERNMADWVTRGR